MSISKNFHENLQAVIVRMEKYADRAWYPPLIGLLALLDNLVVVIPTDGTLVASTLLVPKRWALFAVSISIGSTLGAVILALLVQHYGLPWILDFYPGVNETSLWMSTEKFFNQYGLLFVFAYGATPLTQQPVIILAALSHSPMGQFAAALFFGRFIKFLAVAYLATHSPKLLKRIWGMKSEMKDAGVDLDNK